MGCMKELEEHDHAWDLLDDCGMICGAVACCLACMTNGLCGRSVRGCTGQHHGGGEGVWEKWRGKEGSAGAKD